MRDKDSTEKLAEKDARPLTGSRPEAAPGCEASPLAEKELTDEQIAAIAGGSGATTPGKVHGSLD
jgi:hypothetical protein